MNADHTHQIYGHINISPPAHYLAPAFYPSDYSTYNQLLHNKFIDDVMKNDALFTDQPAKAPMSTIDKIKAERREKREREELEAKFQEWDEIFASERADVGFFTRDIGEKTYRYAAINADERWYLTGMETRAFTVEDFIAWLIEHDVQTENFVWLETIE